jgi:hypothetical protein
MTTTAEILSTFVGSRVIVRTRVSGVSLGTLARVSDDGTTAHLMDSWRIWSWSGTAFTLSEIARDGAGKLRVDQHPDSGIIMVDTAGLEILQVTPEIEDQLRSRWEVGSR